MVGCPQALRVTIPVDLGEALGTFDVVAGEAVQHRATRGVPQSSIDIGSGTVAIDPDDITFTPADNGGGKIGANLQGGNLIITAWIDAVDAVDAVCETGEEYGPFTVELDDDYNIVDVNPSSVTLTPTTIDLLNGGEFSLCIEVTSPVDGTVSIDTLTFRVGL
jgi:hypothetical protein